MKKLIATSIFLLAALIMVQAQKREAVKELNELEWKTFKEFIRYSERYIPDTNIDVTFYCLDLDIAIDSPYITGWVCCNFEPMVDGLDQIRLSLNSSLTVNDVMGDVTSFLQTGDSIIIDLDDSYNIGDQLEVIIDYEGVPVLAGGYKGLRYETHHNNEPIIATLSTPYLAHYWYPCKDGPSDKPDSVFVDIEIPVKYVNGIEVMAISNGVFEGIIDNGATKTYMWRHRYPVVPYYVMVAISNYVKFSEDYSGIYGEEYPLDYYVFRQDSAEARQGVEDLPLALDIFSEKFGEYPFSNEKYGMTQLGFYGAIENQTNTIQNSLRPSWYYISVHELGHMWFGDMITCGNWHHGWLNEGFATYSEAVYKEEVNGYEAYLSYVESFEYWNGGTLYLENANDTFNIFQSIIYNKGAYVLHMLRGVLGEVLFWEGIYDYSTHPDLMYGQAETEDLQQVLEDVSGEDLAYFFEQWIYDEYYPHYLYNFENMEDSVSFVLWQVQEQYGRRPVFTMPMDVLILFESGADTTIRIWNDEIYQLYSLPTTEAVTMIIPDPEKYILCQKTYSPEIPVGIKESALGTGDIRIYPNPVKEQYIVHFKDFESNTYLKIFDIRGKEVSDPILIDSEITVLNRQNLHSGVYIFSLTRNGQLLGSGRILFE
jgi:aminopeptidase N